MLYVGIDVASEDHVFAVVDEQERVLVKPTSFREEEVGYRKLMEALGDPSQALVAMEATGHYWKNLFAALSAQRYSVALLNALAGHPDDRARISIRRDDPVVVSPDERAPAADTLLLDADAEQERVLARIAAGHSLAVHTLPGTGGTQTVINAIGQLVHDNKRVLVVSARRSTLDGIRHRLAGVGLTGLAVSPHHVRRDLIRAIGRNEKAEQPKVAEIDDALVRLRTVLRDYRSAVTEPHLALGVSALDVLREDRGPRRRTAKRRPRDSAALPKLSFRWRTTTPSPRHSWCWRR